MKKTCLKHPKYGGIVPPKVACEDCWVMYLGISEACLNCGCEALALERDDEDGSQ